MKECIAHQAYNSGMSRTSHHVSSNLQFCVFIITLMIFRTNKRHPYSKKWGICQSFIMKNYTEHGGKKQTHQNKTAF